MNVELTDEQYQQLTGQNPCFIHYHPDAIVYIDDIVPDQAGHENDVLVTNGSQVLWRPIISDPDLVQALTGKDNQTGFPVDVDGNYLTTMTYNETTRTVTLAAVSGTTFDVMVRGTVYTFSSPQNVTHSSLSTDNFCYVDENGSITVSSSPWDLLKNAPFCFIFQDVTNGRRIPFEERHHAEADVYWHRNQHAAEGTKATGSGFQISGYTLGGTTDADLTYTITTGRIEDEDIRVDTEVLPDGGPYTMIQRVGASGEWQLSRTNTVPLFRSGANVQYNQNTGATWQLTNLANGTYCNYWVFGVTALPQSSITPAPGAVQQFVVIPGQAVFATEADAHGETVASLAWGSVPFQELVPLFQVTLRYQGGQSSITRLVRIIGTAVSITAAGQTDHGALSGLSDPDHPASAIINTPAGNISSITVQAAINELDTEKAALAGATFTGAVIGLTPAVDTNTTDFATTAFVVGQAGNAVPLMDDGATAGTSFRYSRQDHVHPTDTTRAPLASPTFTGTFTFNTNTINWSLPYVSTLTGEFNGSTALAGEVFNASYPAISPVAGNVQRLSYNFTGGGGATLPSVTGLQQNFTYNTTKSQSPTTNLAISNNATWTGSNTGNAGHAQLYRARGFLSSSGNITTATQLVAAGWSLSSTGAITTSIGVGIDASVGHATLVTTAVGVDVGALVSASDVYGVRSAVASGTNKWNLYASGTAQNAIAGNLRIGSTTAPTTTLDVTGSIAASVNITIAGLDVGWKTIPQNSQSAAYGLVAADSGKHIFHPSADTTARTWTIPANGSVAYPIGTAITFVNQNGAGTVTIAITTDTMRLAGTGATGSRTLAANGIATALKVTSTEWIISGTGLT